MTLNNEIFEILFIGIFYYFPNITRLICTEEINVCIIIENVLFMHRWHATEVVRLSCQLAPASTSDLLVAATSLPKVDHVRLLQPLTNSRWLTVRSANFVVTLS